MHRKLGALLAAFAILSIVWTGPAAAQTAPYPLAETRWNGSASFDDGSTVPMTSVHFRTDGVLVYTDDVGTHDNGRWRQRDLMIIFEMNNYFVLLVGLENDADHMSGHVYNMVGQRGTWTLTRQR